MKCFTHPTADAVAVCKSCGRGLCPECYVEVGTASTCKNRCEERVRDESELVAKAIKLHKGKTGSGVYLRSGLFCFLLGLVFAGFGYYTLQTERMIAPGYFMLILGAIYILYGLTQLCTARKYN